MRRNLAKLERMRDFGEILAFVRDIAGQFGAVRQSYHFTPVFEAPTSHNTVIAAEGFPMEWIALYDSENFLSDDPIPELTLEDGRFLTWEQAMSRAEDSERVARYISARYAHGLQYGIGMALFGPRNRTAYASFGFDEDPAGMSEGKLALLHSLMQAAHMQICRLLDEQPREVTLSRREQQVLEWIGKGKSGTDIAAILGISHDTVRTYTRRIFDKLDVTDRVGATVKGLQMGLIRP